MRDYHTDAALRPQPKRHGPDDWTTPRDLVIPLIDHVLPLLPVGAIWEPAPGRGALVDALEAVGRTVVITRANFMTQAPPLGVRILLSNPPFNQMDRFVERGLALVDGRQLDAMVWLWRWDHFPTKLRVPWVNRAFAVHYCWWRTRWIPGTKTSPRFTFAWIVWLASYPGPPTLCGSLDRPV